MTKKEKVLSVTDEINGKAKEIMKQGDKTSLEAIRFEFCNFLDEYYDKLSGSSKKLSDYEKLNAKEYEIEIIDKLLEQRFDEYKVGVKSKLEATDETTI